MKYSVRICTILSNPWPTPFTYLVTMAYYGNKSFASSHESVVFYAVSSWRLFCFSSTRMTSENDRLGGLGLRR